MQPIRLARDGLLLLGLAGCGHSGPSAPTLSVSCGGSLMLAGATTIDVATAAGGRGTVLSFADPADPGHTGTLPVTPGQSCSIAPVVNKPESGSDKNS